MPEIITSKDNSRLKFARAARDGRTSNAIFIEGLRLAEETAAANLTILDYFFTADFAAAERGQALIKNLPANSGAEISDKLLESIADTKTPQGVIVIAEKPVTGKSVLPVSAASLFVILHELNNPANVGAILRTAEAANAAGVILTAKCADVFSPKSLRAAMGSAFRVPLWTNAEFGAAIEFCRTHQIKIICTAVNAEKSHYSIDWQTAAAVVIGSEARGLAPEEIAACDESLKIPMQFPVESLNAAVACGVILYEAQRQKTRN